MMIDITNYFNEDEVYVKPWKGQGTKLALFKRGHSKQRIEDINGFHIGRFGKYVRLPLAFEIDKDWFYISELLRTDGHITRRMDVIKLTSVTAELKRNFKSFFKKCGIVHFRENVHDRIEIHSKTLALIFVRIFQIPVGNKTFKCRMPRWMKDANLGLLSCALRGAFDGDGCVQLTLRKNRGHTRRIRLYGASIGYLKDIQESLLRFAINSRIFKDPRENKTYYLQISKRDDILRYAQNIGFYHPRRKDTLSRLVTSYRNYYFLSNFEAVATKILREKGPLTIHDLSKEVNRKDSTVSEQVTRLEKQGKLKTKRIGVRRLVSI